MKLLCAHALPEGGTPNLLSFLLRERLSLLHTAEVLLIAGFIIVLTAEVVVAGAVAKAVVIEFGNKILLGDTVAVGAGAVQVCRM